ncbi:carbohydrate-binding family 9-like protein, partial [bacterium]|nr:carbohydrate-binding family 9-like protein [bacterium]
NAEVGAFKLNVTGEEPGKMTAVRIVYDSTCLYIGFECRDSDAASTVTGRDGPVSDEEYVSACIDADSDSITSVVFDIAPTGAVSDAFVLSRDDGAETKILGCWNCEHLRTSVVVYGGGAAPGTDDRFWTVEMAVPWGELYTARRTPPLPGDVWSANFFRVELTGNREYSSYSPTGTDTFHKPSRFARIVFRE